jgi:hypothetical protein
MYRISKMVNQLFNLINFMMKNELKIEFYIFKKRFTHFLY